MTDEAIRAQLAKVLASQGFAGSERLRSFLRFVVEEKLAGRADQIKEYAVGVDVYRKDASYDPRLDATVRVEASKLRARLTAYYDAEGRDDPIRIEIPKGSYVPAIRETVREAPAVAAEARTDAQEVPPPPNGAYFRRRHPAIGIGLAVVAVAAGLLLWTRQPKPVTTRLVQLTSDTGLAGYPTLSADARFVAYASDRAGRGDLDIWIQPVARREPVRLTDDPANEVDPSFSPDGSRIAFQSERDGGGIWVVSSLGGGTARLLVAGGRRPRFSPDGRWIAYYSGPRADQLPMRVCRISADGGTPEQLELGLAWSGLPIWSPDGERLLFLGGTSDQAIGEDWDWWSAPSGGGKAVRCGAADLFRRHGLAGVSQVLRTVDPNAGGLGSAIVPGCWVGNRVVVTGRAGDSANLWDIAVDATGRVTGAPRRLTTGSAREIHSWAVPEPGDSGRRSIAFTSLTLRADLWSLPIDGNRGTASGPAVQLTHDGVENIRPSVSADGRRLVFGSTRSGNLDVWVRDLTTGRDVAVTATPRTETHGYISPDGTRVAYDYEENEKWSICVSDLASTPEKAPGPGERVCEGCGRPLHWSPDGRSVLFHWGTPTRFSALELASGRRVDVIRHPTKPIYRAQYSPDGEWLAFQVYLVESNRSIVFLAPLHDGVAGGEREWIPVTDGSWQDAAHPWFSPDGNLLYFLSSRDGFVCVWLRPLDPATKRPAGAARPVHHLHQARYGNGGNFGGALTATRLFYSLAETTGNIRLLELGER
jgi:Tol biopolymer transport system component